MQSLHARVKMRCETNLPKEGVIPVSTTVVPAATVTLRICKTSPETCHWDKVRAACVILPDSCGCLLRDFGCTHGLVQCDKSQVLKLWELFHLSVHVRDVCLQERVLPVSACRSVSSACGWQ